MDLKEGTKLREMMERRTKVLGKLRERSKRFKSLTEDLVKACEEALHDEELRKRFVNFFSTRRPNTPDRTTLYQLLCEFLEYLGEEYVSHIFERSIPLLRLYFYTKILEADFDLIPLFDLSSLHYSLMDRPPDTLLYKISGEKTEMKVADDSIERFKERAVKFKFLGDEVEVVDEGPRGEDFKLSQMGGIVRETSEISPTIIKYTDSSDEFKRLLLCIPPNLDFSTFKKEYGGKLGAIHSDFYKEMHRHRPNTRVRREREISDLLEKYGKLERFSLNKLYKLIGNELGLDPSTIKRHHKNLIKDIRGSAKNRD
jgi:hypothetical protein